MGAKNKVELILTGDAKGATRAFKDVDGAAHGLSGKLSSLGQHLGKIAVAFAGMYVIREVGGFLIDAGKAAAADAEQQAKLANVVQNVTGATDAQIVSMESWITKTQMATGISDSMLRPALQNLVVATKDVGAAQDLMGVAMDVSVAKGLNLETVTKAMQKAHDGNTGALSKLGIATKDAEGKSLSFAEVVANMSATFSGSAATAADTLAGKTARIGEMFGEAKESLGAVFMPVLEQFMGWVTANMPTIQAVFETAFAAIGAAMDWITTNVIPPLMNIFGALRDFVRDDAVPALKESWGSMKAWWDQYGPEIIALVDNLKAAFGGVVSLVSGTWHQIKDAIMGSDPSGKLNENAQTLGQLLTAFNDVLSWVRTNWPTIGPIVRGAIDVALLPLLEFIRTLNTVKSAIEAVVSAIQRLNSTHVQSKQVGTTPSVLSPHSRLRQFASGGMIPGTGPQLAIVHGGERVLTPEQQRQGGGITVTVYNSGSVVTENDLVRSVIDGIRQAQRLNGAVFA